MGVRNVGGKNVQTKLTQRRFWSTNLISHRVPGRRKGNKRRGRGHTRN